jgi:hypothetical protein
MLQCNLDDLVAGEVCFHRPVLTTLSNDIGLVSFLAVHAETVFIAEDSYGLQRKLVRGTKDSDRDLASICNEYLLELHDRRVGPEPGMDGVLMVRVVILGCSGAAGSGRHFDVRND